VVNIFSVFERLERGESVSLRSEEFDAPPTVDEPWLGVQSSGSTGLPKLIWRRWSELLADVRMDPRWSSWTWAASFETESFAGVQVALQAWRNGGTIVWFGNDWEENWRLINSAGIHALSCTPTFLDLLLQFEPTKPQDRGTPGLQQITLGGEVLRESSGRRFAARFPEARFTVIYAAAEHGVLLKTRRLDGWYESDLLDRRFSGDWRVNDGVLELRKRGPWISTGDQVEIDAGLVRVIGRIDAVANVGGVKVSLDEVSRLAEEVPGVRRALAVAESSPVVGQVVALKFALEPACDLEKVQPLLEEYLRSHLRKEAWPRRWELDPVGLGSNSKRVRL
jgi:long-chain acyl-CoA synthetase